MLKVDFVIDPLANDDTRPRVQLSETVSFTLDTMNNIVSNKFSTLVNRTEPKDYIDFYFLLSQYQQLQIEDLYESARKKDATFDDPPTIAYIIEDGISRVLSDTRLFPAMKKQIDLEGFQNFYSQVSKNIYAMNV